MKKLIPLFTFVCAVTLFAGEGGKLLDQFADAAKVAMPPGGTVRKDGRHGILFFDIPTGGTSDDISPAVILTRKENFLRDFRRTKESSFVKRNGVTLIFNYITTDRKIFSFVVTAKDL